MSGFPPDGDPDEGPFSEIPGGGSGDTTSPVTISNVPTGTGNGNDPSLSISSTGLPSQSSSPDDPTIWTLETVNDTQTCESITVSWNLTSGVEDFDTTVDLTLQGITNTSISIDLANDRPIDDIPLVANNVSVPVGTYVIRGQDSATGFLQTSNRFRVTPGNTTCLDSSQTTSTAATASHPSNTTSSLSSSHASKTAMIVGGTVGSIAALGFIVLGALWFILYRRNRASSLRQKRRIRGGWGGLDSVEYKPNSAVLAGAGAGATTRRSTSSVGKDADKLDVLVIDHPTNSLSSLGYDHPANPQGYPPVRSPSVASTSHSHEMTRLPVSSPPATPARVGSGSLEPTGTPSTSDPFTPAATGGSNKRSSRTQRKPVPTYEPTPEELVQLAIARSHSDSGIQRSGSSSKSSSRTPSLAPISASLGSSSPLSSSPHAQAMLENLKNKSSGHFVGDNDGNVHLLIPDPPMPPRN